MLLAACGLALSVGAHALSLAGQPVPGGKLVWVLHAGIFVVWVPAVLVLRRPKVQAGSDNSWKSAFAGCPAWMRGGLYFLFGYAMLNFLWFVATADQHKKPAGDAPASVIRGFSGHWMAFYGAAFGIFYSRRQAPHLYREHQCPLGHHISPTDRFCPICGTQIPSPSENG